MKVLISIDYSKESELILNKARTFLKAFPDAEVHIFSVLDIAQAASGPGFNTMQADMDNLHEVCKKIFDGGNIHFTSQQGYPASAIAEYAHALKCDLLIIGTHGRTGMDHLITGSVAEKVLRNVNCNTLVIPVKNKI